MSEQNNRRHIIIINFNGSKHKTTKLQPGDTHFGSAIRQNIFHHHEKKLFQERQTIAPKHTLK